MHECSAKNFQLRFLGQADISSMMVSIDETNDLSTTASEGDADHDYPVKTDPTGSSSGVN